MDAHAQVVRRERILVVDDLPANLALLKHILSSVGFDPTLVTGGPEALASVADSRPDLILLDIVMPGMDGFEVCKILKSQAATRTIPILLISGLSETDAKIKGLGLGASDYVTKPFETAEIVARIETQLRIGRLESRLRHSESAMRHAEHIARIGTWTKDLATGAIEWSDEMFELFGEGASGRSSSIAEIVARKVCKEDRETVESILLGAAEIPSSLRAIEFRIIDPAGAERLLQATVAPGFGTTPDEDAHLIGTIQDITEIRHPASAAAAAVDRHSRILRSLPTGFLLMDSRFVLLEANDSFQHMTGYDESELVGRGVGILDVPQAAVPLESTIYRAFMSGFEQVRSSLRRRDGREIPVALVVGSDEQAGSMLYVFVRELDPAGPPPDEGREG